MKYSIQCRYSMVEQTFMFIIKSLEQGSTYQFTWLISNVDNPVYVLTNNNIIFKSYLEDNYVMFQVAQSEKPLNEKMVMTKTVPILVFETDQSNLEIIYDYDHIPNDKDKFVGKIIHEFLQVAGGGFLDNVQDYTNLENNISNILNQHETFLTKQANEKNTEKTVAKKQVKTKNNKENNKPQQVTAKTAKKKTNKENAK